MKTKNINLSPKAIKILGKVKELILANPEQYDQDRGCTPDSFSDLDSCGTPGCIFGWVIKLSKRKGVKGSSEVFVLGAKLLGLGKVKDSSWMARATDNDILILNNEKIASNLFWTWPQKWRNKYDRFGRGTREAAQVAAEYIDFYIEKDGNVHDCS